MAPETPLPFSEIASQKSRRGPRGAFNFTTRSTWGLEPLHSRRNTTARENS
jgi:hypothetical protein